MPILVSEATTMRDGIQAAVDAGFSHVHIEGDNQLIIQAVRGFV